MENKLNSYGAQYKHFVSIAVLLLGFGWQSVAQKPELFIFSIGISNYQDNRLDLNYAQYDAIDLANAWKKQTDLYDIMETVVLTNEMATRENIRRNLERIKKIITADDMFVFIYSGHGMEDGLVPYDFKANDPEASGITKRFLKDAISNLGCNSIILIDACHSGSFAKVPGTKHPPGQYDLTIDQAARELADALHQTDKNSLTVASSSSDQSSFESPAFRHGYFAQALLDCFEGKTIVDKFTERSFQADPDGDSFVRVGEFERYIAEAVRIYTTQLPNPQKVRILKATGTDFPILRTAGNIGITEAPVRPPKPEPVVIDSDKDGVPDKEDNCPREYGIKENNGCPKIERFTNKWDKGVFIADISANVNLTELYLKEELEGPANIISGMRVGFELNYCKKFGAHFSILKDTHGWTYMAGPTAKIMHHEKYGLYTGLSYGFNSVDGGNILGLTTWHIFHKWITLMAGGVYNIDKNAFTAKIGVGAALSMK